MSEPMSTNALRKTRKIAEDELNYYVQTGIVRKPLDEITIIALLDEVERLRDALKGAMVVADTAKGLTAENARLRAELEAAKRDLALIPTICYGDCTGDPSVGVPNCPFYEGPYTHWEAGLPIASGCRFAPKDAENGGANEKG